MLKSWRRRLDQGDKILYANLNLNNIYIIGYIHIHFSFLPISESITHWFRRNATNASNFLRFGHSRVSCFILSLHATFARATKRGGDAEGKRKVKKRSLGEIKSIDVFARSRIHNSHFVSFSQFRCMHSRDTETKKKRKKKKNGSTLYIFVKRTRMRYWEFLIIRVADVIDDTR